MDSIQILSMPRRVLMGLNSSRQLPRFLLDDGIHGVQIVADSSMERLGYGKSLTGILEEAGLSVSGVWIVPSGEPAAEKVKAFIAEAALGRQDAVLAFGGGSAIDTAKILSVAYTNREFSENPLRAGLITRPGVPLIAVPTTAGTGAEATPNAILLDTAAKNKIGVVSPFMIPRYVALDAEYMRELPFDIAVSTGFDAFAHALESFLSKKASYASEPFALQAVSMIVNNLETACRDNDTEARQKMLAASFYAGTCLVTASTHLIHAMAYPLSGSYHVSHGKAISSLLLPGLRALQKQATQGLRKAGAAAFSVAADDRAVQMLLSWVEETQEKLSGRIPLREYGVTLKDFSWMAKESLENKRLFDNCPAPFSQDAVEKIYAAAY